jgi:hypothetical protein
VQPPTPTAEPAAAATAQVVAGVVAITEYGGTQKPEYIQITNMGAQDVDLTNWRLHSVRGDQWYDFPPATILPVGASLRIVSGKDVDCSLPQPPGVLCWTSNYIWNDKGDEAILYDASGAQVSSASG